MAGPQRVLVDMTMAKGGGGYTYAVNIVPRLLASGGDCVYRVLVRNPRIFQQISSYADPEVLQIELLPEAGYLERLRFTYWDSWKLAKKWKADVYFSAGESIPAQGPFARIASFRNPAIFTPIEEAISPNQRKRLRLLRMLCQVSAARAHQVMFVSADSAQWIGDQLGIPQDRRFVNHHGIDPRPWRLAKGEAPPLSQPYILSVGHIYRYKNFERLIEAFGELARRRPIPHDLVIIGDSRQEPETHRQILQARERLGALSTRVHVMGEVPYEDVQQFYRHADLFVFPSFLETFGHPILEAMACDVPVVAADCEVFREIAGDAAVYGDPFDSRSLGDAMGEALLRYGLRESLVKGGSEVVKRFSWDRSAARLHELFERASMVHAAGGSLSRHRSAPGRLLAPQG